MDDIEQELQKQGLTDEVYWQDYEYEFFEKEPGWFWIFGTIATLAIILSLILKDRLFAIVILLGAITIGMYSKRAPRQVPFGLAKHGIKAGGSLFLYDTIKSFWVEAGKHKLIIETSRIIRPHITIPLGNVHPEIIRSKLISILPEKRYLGSLIDTVSDFFGI
ncbi:MAG: hypothetical protein AAB645_01775 [Patescibacteria group bacterium]